MKVPYFEKLCCYTRDKYKHSLRKGFLGSTTHYLSNRIKKGIIQWFTVRYLEDIFVQVQ